jgi:hypothetical protein
MANRIGKFQIELFRNGSDVPAVIGTEGISWVDGRWSNSRAYDYIASLARDYCERHNTRATVPLEWRGSVYLLNGRNRSIAI